VKDAERLSTMAFLRGRGRNSGNYGGKPKPSPLHQSRTQSDNDSGEDSERFRRYNTNGRKAKGRNRGSSNDANGRFSDGDVEESSSNGLQQQNGDATLSESEQQKRAMRAAKFGGVGATAEFSQQVMSITGANTPASSNRDKANGTNGAFPFSGVPTDSKTETKEQGLGHNPFLVTPQGATTTPSAPLSFTSGQPSTLFSAKPSFGASPMQRMKEVGTQ
jgi:hypothetical protein